MKKLFLFIVALGLFAYFVWPTRYVHYPPGDGPRTERVKPYDSTRVDRLTGDIEVFESSGEWHWAGNVRKALAFENPDVNPNAVHKPTRPYDQSKAQQQQQSIENTQKAVDDATKSASN